MHNTESMTGFGCALLGICSVALVACGGKVASDDVGKQGNALSRGERELPPLPSPALEVPAGNELGFHFDAIGVQIYGCTATGWVFQAPEASLYDKHGRIVGKHYAGPTWEYQDGSKVVGKKLAAATPDPTAISWLLLQAVSHDGDGRMTPVTYIQRLETTGGIAPATGCDASSVGAVARVPYTATYYFYRADDGQGDGEDDCDSREH